MALHAATRLVLLRQEQVRVGSSETLGGARSLAAGRPRHLASAGAALAHSAAADAPTDQFSPALFAFALSCLWV